MDIPVLTIEHGFNERPMAAPVVVTQATKSCPCNGCPYYRLCRDEKKACQRFHIWHTRGEVATWIEPEPSKFFYQKLQQ